MTQADRTWTPEDQGWLRENLREAIDHLVEMGYTVRGGQGEDQESIRPGGFSHPGRVRRGTPTRNGCPADSTGEEYRLQVELLKFQYWGQDQELRHVIVFEGRDAGRQGWNDQALHRAPESPLCPSRGIEQTLRP